MTDGDCDCCGRMRPLTRCWAYGIETFACDECLGIEPEDEADELTAGRDQ